MINTNTELDMIAKLLDKKKHFRLYDSLIVYFFVFLNILILIYHNNLSAWELHFIKHLVIVLFVAGFVIIMDQQTRPVLVFIRNWYPVLSYPFIYRNLLFFLHMVFPGELDSMILSLEMSVFGVLPNLWLQKIVNPVLTEIMQISYAVYWFTIPISAAILYFKNRPREYEYLIFYVTVTFFVSYLFFIFFPVAGPRFTLASEISVSYDGLFMTKYLRGFVASAGFRGGAFPSSHVAVAVVVYIFMYTFERKNALRYFLPAVIALSLATVYGQYHYLTDMIAGLVLGILIGFTGIKHFKKSERLKAIMHTDVA